MLYIFSSFSLFEYFDPADVFRFSSNLNFVSRPILSDEKKISLIINYYNSNGFNDLVHFEDLKHSDD